MREAITQLDSSTIAVLKHQFANVSDWQQANARIRALSGIEPFFTTQEEYKWCTELLDADGILRETIDRREYGDYQTPFTLAEKICKFLADKGVAPDTLIEPTFGKGAFVLAALKAFPSMSQVYGVEIHAPYVWYTKFLLFQFNLQRKPRNLPAIELHCQDVYTVNFHGVAKQLRGDVLILGNPPWVTNAELGTLRSSNLPRKRNIKNLQGIDAITGKGNFDIAEFILLQMLNAFANQDGHLALLVKNTVIRNLVQELPNYPYLLGDLVACEINAQQHFGASVEASLFSCRLNSPSDQYQCTVTKFDTDSPIRKFGWVRNQFVSNVDHYETTAQFDGNSPFTWWQGMKHDCAKVMELRRQGERFVNGFGEEVELEDDLIYGLVKSSDLRRPVVYKTRRQVIVPQMHPSQEIEGQLVRYPRLYAYLQNNRALFEKRRSSIYKNKSPFAIFGIGDYSFAPYKVAISGLYKKPCFVLVLPQNGRPVMADDTCYFLGFDVLANAACAWAVLNHPYVHHLLDDITFQDAKRPFTKRVLMRIGLDVAAREIQYDEVVEFIGKIDEGILREVSEEQWLNFVASFEPGTAEMSQLSLF